MDTPWRLVGGEATDRPLLPDLAASASAFVVLLGLVVVAWDPLLAFDEAAVDALNEAVSGTGPVVTALRFLTDLGGAQAAWLLIPLVVVWLLVRRAPRAAAFAAAAGVGAAILDPAVKALVGRTRPVVDVTVATAPGPSFPSGHALGSTVTYGVLVLVFLPAVPHRHRRAVAAAAASIVAVVGLTRVALGVHNPSDVVAGWALGLAWLAVGNVVFLQPGRVAASPGTDALDGRPSQPAPRARDALPEGGRSVASLVVGAVLLWGALLGLGELLSEPTGVVLDLDATIIDVLVSIRTESLSRAAGLVGHLGGTAGIIAGLVIASSLALAVTRRWRPPLFVLAAVVGESLIFYATVTIVDRGRPEVPVLTGNLPPTPSFPSGHVAAALALYGAAALLVGAWGTRWLGRLALTLAIVVVLGVSLSRLYTGVHYPTDVIASMLFTIVWLAICWRVLRPGPRRLHGHDTGSTPATENPS